MLTPKALPLAALLTLSLLTLTAAAADPEWKPFTVGGPVPAPAEAKAFDAIRDGMTLEELVKALGPGYIPALSGSGMIHWSCQDGRTIRISHATDKAAVVTADGRGGERNPWIRMEDAQGKNLAIPKKK